MSTTATTSRQFHIGRGNKVVTCTRSCKVKSEHYAVYEQAEQIARGSLASTVPTQSKSPATESTSKTKTSATKKAPIPAAKDLLDDEVDLPDLDSLFFTMEPVLSVAEDDDMKTVLDDLSDLEWDDEEDSDTRTNICDHCDEEHRSVRNRKDPYEEREYGNCVWRNLCDDCHDELKYG